MIRPYYLLCFLALAGCKKPEIQSYIAPKDKTLDSVAPSPTAEPMPQVAWEKLPNGWTQTQARQMSVATFTVEDNHGEAAVTISPLPNLAGREDAIVNMWREQVQLGPLTPEEMAKALEPAEVAGGEGRVFEISGSADGKPRRTVAAMLHRGDRSWFFKLSGDDTVVSAHRTEFLAFVKTVRLTEPPPGPGAASSAPEPPSTGNSLPPMGSSPAGGAPSAAGSFKWSVPTTWQTNAPGNMQVAKFAVPAKDSAKADVTVSIFPSESGGTLGNVNRWRRQIGLGEIDEAGLATCTKPIDGITGAVLVDLKSDARSLLGAIVPRNGQWFFYKLLGDSPAVEAAHEDFVKFVRSEP